MFLPKLDMFKDLRQAECLAPTKVMKIDRAGLEKVFDAHARSGRVFYKGVAKAVGQAFTPGSAKSSCNGRLESLPHGISGPAECLPMRAKSACQKSRW